jgi:hypothetical protein
LESPGLSTNGLRELLIEKGVEMADETSQASRSPRFRRIELLVLVAVIVGGIILLMPAIQAAREAGRRANCLCHAAQFGLSIQNYASNCNNAFPPSAGVYTDPSGHKTAGGYSVFVKLLPYMEYTALYNKFPKAIPNGDLDAAISGNPALAEAMNTPLKELICPSNPNKAFQNPNSNPPQFPFTNFKAVSASTRDSLLMAVDKTATPPYGEAKMHPDGVLYPSDKDLLAADVKDGSSHTIYAMETMDDIRSRWMVGNECMLVGLPQASSPAGDKPLGHSDSATFFAPPGFDGKFGENSAVARAGLRTFLDYDFGPKGADAGKYEDPGWAKAPPAYGPSSAHAAVVIVSMADGSDMALSKKADAANLFFLITKDNQDPFNIP